MSSRFCQSLYRGLVIPLVKPNSSFSTSSISSKTAGDKMSQFKDSVEKEGKKLVGKAATGFEKVKDKMTEVHEQNKNDVGRLSQEPQAAKGAASESVKQKAKGPTDAVEDVK
ncbi:hypothetical protein JTE90_016464 [Oedothorax gibbosus]|uniref:Uncharacterized protein n=1 Tax=Oedothorax gibbosus TaxID=931172 RepID=A0AAV6V5B6_9ARAC|nr:hypothetical protein JTE90_016464 [Oedothorax gibbosus]